MSATETAKISEIRQAMAACLAAVYAPDWQVSAYALANPSDKCIDVWPNGITYDTAMMGGNHDMHFQVRVAVADTLDQAWQALLDDLADPEEPGSIKATLEADYTLGGVVSALRVETVGAYQEFSITGGTRRNGYAFDVLVMP